jgi:hypothetical protein
MKELKDTIDGMLSDDWKERFAAEYEQLSIRLEKLDSLIESSDENSLWCDRLPILAKQRLLMQSLKRLLDQRAVLEGIDLGEWDGR